MFYGTLPQDTQSFDQVLRGIGQNVQQFGRAAQYVPYDILGAPVDIATLAMRPFGYQVENPVGGSDWLINLARQMGVADKPTGSGAELAGRVAFGAVSPVAATKGLTQVGRFVDMLKETPPVGSVNFAPQKIQTTQQLTDEYTSLQTKVNQLDEKIRSGEFSIKDVNERAKSINRLEELNTSAYPQTQPVVQSQPEGLLDTTYRGLHTAPNRYSGAQLFELNKIYPDDIYSSRAGQFYGHFGGNDPMDIRTIRLAKSLRGKPDADVTIYRAVPKDESIKSINKGDWVTINPDYAKEHGESVLLGDYKILKKKVKAKDIWTNADSIHEYGYDPD